MDVDLKSWYKPNIDKKEFKKLCKKSDWQGFKHMIIYFSFLGFLVIWRLQHGAHGGLYYFF